MLDLLAIVGARPQFIKLAPLIWAAKKVPEIRLRVVHTGQHYDPEMSDNFFADFELPEPDYHLGIGGGQHGAVTGRMLEEIEKILLKTPPDAVVVFGDTNSTLAGALAAAKLHVPIVHIEAGLRSFDKHMPEEVNRLLTDHVSDLLICPTATSVKNLANEGITDGVHQTGDIMFDVALFIGEKARAQSRILDDLGLSDGYSVATIHRASNTDTKDQLRAVIDFLQDQAKEAPVVFPVHPRTKAALARFGISTEGLTTCEPLGYVDITRLVQGAAQVLTDSGGLQKEAYFHRVPCVTLRDTTEWVETIDCGWNRLWTEPNYEPRKDIGDYGDGHSAKQMIKIMQAFLGK